MGLAETRFLALAPNLLELNANCNASGVRARVIEIKLEEEKLKLGLKESYFVDVEDEVKPERLVSVEEPDLDEDMLDAAEVDSDEGDWRNAALESPETADEGESKIFFREDIALLLLGYSYCRTLDLA